MLKNKNKNSEKMSCIFVRSDLLRLNCAKRALEILIRTRFWSNVSKRGTQRADSFLMSNYSAVVLHHFVNFGDVFVGSCSFWTSRTFIVSQATFKFSCPKFHCG